MLARSAANKWRRWHLGDLKHLLLTSHRFLAHQTPHVCSNPWYSCSKIPMCPNMQLHSFLNQDARKPYCLSSCHDETVINWGKSAKLWAQPNYKVGLIQFLFFKSTTHYTRVVEIIFPSRNPIFQPKNTTSLCGFRRHHGHGGHHHRSWCAGPTCRPRPLHRRPRRSDGHGSGSLGTPDRCGLICSTVRIIHFQPSNIQVLGRHAGKRAFLAVLFETICWFNATFMCKKVPHGIFICIFRKGLLTNYPFVRHVYMHSGQGWGLMNHIVYPRNLGI